MTTQNLCVYTPMQVAKFPHVHLVAGGWYLDCSRGFVPEEEEPLYNSLVSSAPEVIELEEEPEEDENPAPPAIDKEVAPVKAKGKGKRVASSQVSTRSFTKASVQRTPATTVVGSPTATPSAPSRDHVPAPSHSGVTIPSVPRKRKAVAPDTSATSSEKSSSLSLIENVDMGELIEDLMRSKVPPPAYRRIQEFLTKVCATILLFSRSFILIQQFFLIFFFGFLISRLERVVFVLIPSLRCTQGLIYSLQMCRRTSVCRASRHHRRMFLNGTSVLPLTLRFCLPLQTPTSMTMAFLSLHTPLILTCLDPYITGHIQRTSTLPKTGLA